MAVYDFTPAIAKLPKDRRPTADILVSSGMNKNILQNVKNIFKLGRLWNECDPWEYFTQTVYDQTAKASKEVDYGSSEYADSLAQIAKGRTPNNIRRSAALETVDTALVGRPSGVKHNQSLAPKESNLQCRTLSRGYLQHLTTLLPEGSFMRLWFTLQSFNIPLVTCPTGLVYDHDMKTVLPYGTDSFVSSIGATTIYNTLQSEYGRSHVYHTSIASRELGAYIKLHKVNSGDFLWKKDESLRAYVSSKGDKESLWSIDMDKYFATVKGWPVEKLQGVRFGALTFINSFIKGVLPVVLDNHGSAAYHRLLKKMAVPYMLLDCKPPNDAYLEKDVTVIEELLTNN